MKKTDFFTAPASTRFHCACKGGLLKHSICLLYTSTETLQKYDAIDINVYQANLFHTKLLIKEIELQNYLFNTDVYELSPKERLAITDRLRREMIEIFSGTNVYK